MRLWNEIHKVVTAFSARKVRVFVGLMVFAMGILSSLQIRAATVYWDLCSVFCCDDVPIYGDFEPYHRPNECILSVLVIESGQRIPSIEWHSILTFSAEYDLANEIVTYSGGVNGCARFGETIRLYYSTLMSEDGTTPVVGYADFRYEDEPTFDILVDSSYVSIGQDASLPIPEPTCGTLLILGISVMSLRRGRST